MAPTVHELKSDFCGLYDQTSKPFVLQQWFYFSYFTVEYRLLPNPKKACISPILKIFSQPKDFIGIYSQFQKVQLGCIQKKAMKSLYS